METQKLTKEEFTIKAIENLRTDRSKGIHVVWSGYNAAFVAYFGEASRQTTDDMAAKGLIDVHPFEGGAMIYKKGEAPDRTRALVEKITR